MGTQDLSSLIDWNSPVVEFHCKPLIPLPNFDGHPTIDGDNPFDALEKQIDQNEPFDMILNQSLNSSSEEICLDNVMETNNEQLPPKSDEINSVTRVVDDLDRLNLHLDESVPKNGSRYSADVSNVIDVSPIASDASEVQILRKRLSAIIDKFSTSHNGGDRLIANVNPISSSVPSSSEISFYSIKSASVKESDGDENTNSSGSINKAFIGKNSTNDTFFDSLSFNVNNLYEDLNFVNPPTWLSSGSEEESENSPIKNMPAKKSGNLKNKASAEKVEKKSSCPRLPLGSKDPNIRAKRKIAVVKEAGPLKAIIPVENMAKNVNQKLVETPKRNRFSRKLKVDSTSSKLKRRSMPIATSTPVVTPSLSSMNKSKIATSSRPSTPSTQSSRSCPPSPDSTSTRLMVPKSTNYKTKVCSRRLALNVVSSSTSFNYLPSNRKPSKDVKYSSLNSSVKSTATGVKSGTKNKENLVPFRF